MSLSLSLSLSHTRRDSSLFLAARGGHLELVKALLKSEAAVNVQEGSNNISPLHWAAHKRGMTLLCF